MNITEFKKLNIPETPGVYTFKQKGDVLYIGKATSLRERLRSYFGDDLIATRGRLLVDMVTKATSIEYEETDSVLEAFIRETELIKKYQPPYNTKDKDNKSFNYVVITDEDFPRVLTIRGRDIEQQIKAIDVPGGVSNITYKYVFGPYPFGNELRAALKIIRKIFPFRDTCIPAFETDRDSSHIHRPCFNRTIGLCPGVCTGEISKQEYAKTILHIKLFFEGKKKAVLDGLRKEMMAYAKEQKFEQAGNIKKTIFALEHIKDISMIKRDSDLSAKKIVADENNLLQSIAGSKKKKLKKDIVGLQAIVQDWQGQEAKRQYRVESYDIAHMSGKNMVGVMVVMTDGEFDKSQYRKFIIQGIEASDDTGALRQVIQRRFGHLNWKWPDVILVDGGMNQLSAVKAEVQNQFTKITDEYPELHRLEMPQIISLVKNESHKAREILGMESSSHIHLTEEEIISLNAETHRFAITFHKKKRSDNFLPKDKPIRKKESKPKI